MEARQRLLLVVVVVAALCASAAAGGGGGNASSSSTTGYHGNPTFNAKNYGAKGNGVNDDTKPLMSAWKAACSAAGAVTLVLPPGTYYIGPVQFHGPCSKASSMTFLMQGTLKAATDLKRFGNDWIEFGWVNQLTVTGQNGATIDGQGAASWPFNKCPIRKDCKVLPTNVLFVNNKNLVVQNVASLNSKFFHFALLQNSNVKISGVKVSAPGNSPNTDGFHIERSSGVTIADTTIGTGDDCISIGQGNDNIEVARVHCGPGHGMSVGSLGRYVGEGDVTRIHVRDMTFHGTMNGVRIKTWENSPTKSVAAHMLFENLVMNDVQNPIIIDQKYCPYYNCEHKFVSGVTIKDVQFKNVKGTATTPVAVLLKCGVPCQGVVLQDVDLRYKGKGVTSSKCENIKAKYGGYQNPKPCG
ncbi:exopolygalacturonase-like [Oryza brachyantha]|uniref:Exopolygalacturonase n=1 Tax=Oryza brachyantha TaxID=4533 RepID=J3MS65_ORYBR|nr:exopolygalacturonase-like [Oryza brachyantha]